MKKKYPSVLFAADPASHRTGLALFASGVLVDAHLVKATGDYPARVSAMMRGAAAFFDRAGKRHDSDVCVCEWPKIYKFGPGAKADPDDILKVAGIAAAVIAPLDTRVQPGNVHFIHPSEWKQQTGKFNRDDDGKKIYLMWERIGPALSAAEKKVLDDLPDGMGKDDNVLDATGIGLHHLHRI